MQAKIAILALVRQTFDVDYARQVHQSCLAEFRQLPREQVELIGGQELLFDSQAVETELQRLLAEQPHLLLLLQVTFTDASMTARIGEFAKLPLVLWSFPEARTGGRLRLNSFCGVNLAAHALSRRGIRYACLHGRAGDAQLHRRLLCIARAALACAVFRGGAVLVIGQHPEGFDACDYDAEEIEQRLGTSLYQLEIADFIAQAQKVPLAQAEEHLAQRRKVLAGLEKLALEPLLNTMRVYQRLRELTTEYRAFGVAIRCWPQFFTDWGTAACGALAMMGEQGIPCGCEADVYGVLTSRLLASVSGGERTFNTDLVDLDFDSQTCVFWHCGQAPLQMADPGSLPQGAVHSNRKLPLLSQFALKPGVITLCRLTRGGGRLRLFLGQAEMIAAPLAYSGTAGTARFNRPLQEVADRILSEGMEHHSALVYGDYRAELREFARLQQLELVEI